MIKLEYLKLLLNSLNVSKKHLDYLDYIKKEAGIDALTPEERAEKARSLLYGNNNAQAPQAQVTPQETQTQSTPQAKTEQKTERPKDDTPPNPESIKIDCGGESVSIAEKIYDFKNNNFIEGASCKHKKCFLVNVVKNLNKESDILTYIYFIDICKKYYKKTLTNEEFDKFIDKIHSSAYKNKFVKIVNDYTSGNTPEVSSDELEEDPIDIRGYTDNLTAIAESFLGYEKHSEEYTLVSKYRFFEFCRTDLDRVIENLYSISINKKSKNKDINKFIEKYNLDSKSMIGECFEFKKFNLDFKNLKYFKNDDEEIEKQKRSIEDSSAKEYEISKDYKFKSGIDKRFKSMMYDALEVYNDYKDLEYFQSRIESAKNPGFGGTAYYIDECGIVRAKSNNTTEIFEMNKKYEQFDKNRFQVHFMKRNDRIDREYFYSKDSALYVLYILAKENIIPVEFMQIQYMLNGYSDKVKLSASKRFENVDQSSCINKLKEFSKKYNLSSELNPYNFYYKRIRRNVKYNGKLKEGVELYNSKKQKEEEKIDVPDPKNFSLKKLRDIKIFHEKLELAIKKYDESTEDSSQTIADFFTSLFANKNKILLNKNMADITKNAYNSANLFSEVSASLMATTQTGYHTSKDIFKYVPEGSRYKKDPKKNIDYIYLTKEDRDGMISARRMSSDEKSFTDTKGKKWTLAKYNKSARFLPRDYAQDLYQILFMLEGEGCKDPTCGFDTNSKLFQTICESVNSEDNIIDSNSNINKSSVSNVIDNLFFGYFISKLIENKSRYTKYNEDESSVFRQLYELARKTSPSETTLQQFNGDRLKNYKKEIESKVNANKELFMSYMECGKTLYEVYEDEIDIPMASSVPKLGSLKDIYDNSSKAYTFEARKIVEGLYDKMIELLNEKRSQMR